MVRPGPRSGADASGVSTEVSPASRRRRPGDGGFTLIEVLVASTLLIIGALATFALLDNGAAATTVAKQRDVANALAQEMVERTAGARYTPQRNDLVDVDTGAAATIAGPADRMRHALDPDGDQSSTAVTPTTVTTGAPGAAPVDVPQTWSLTRRGTVYAVSYRACTTSDLYQGVIIQGPYDCARAGQQPPKPPNTAPINSLCSLGLIDPGVVDPSNPGQLTIRLQLLGLVGLNVCVGAVSQPLSNALCTLLGTSDLLNGLVSQLLGSAGTLTNLLGGLLNTGATAGLCPTSQVDAGLTGAYAGIATTTRVAVTVGWTDAGGRAHSIQQTTLIRKPTA